MNSFAERWVKSVKEECLSKLILFGEKSLRHALREYVVYYHHERNHQGKENLLLFPASDQLPQSERKVRSRERLGGLLRFYHREARRVQKYKRTQDRRAGPFFGSEVSRLGSPREAKMRRGSFCDAGWADHAVPDVQGHLRVHPTSFIYGVRRHRQAN